MSHFEDVRDFHVKFGLLIYDLPGHLTKRKLQERIETMQEELDEFKAAVETQDLEAQADALIDLVYFAMGTGVMLGLPWRPLWDDVHKRNMKKVRGTTKRGHAVDVTKPEGWKGPKTGKILRKHGYDRTYYLAEEADFVDESTCRDDREHQQTSDNS